MRTFIRALGFVVLLAAAGGVYVGLAPKIITDQPTLPSATQYESLIRQAISDYDLNNLSTDSAMHQEVVNGWLTKDLLTIIAKEQADLLRAQGAIVDATGNLQTQPFDERIPALLVVMVAAVAWASVTAPRPYLKERFASAPHVAPVPA